MVDAPALPGESFEGRTQTSIKRDFRLLWTGEGISMLGTEMSKFAIPLLALKQLDAGASEIGLLRAAGSAPMLVILLFAGVWVDRFRRRPVMVASNLVQASVLLLLGLLAVQGALHFSVLLAGALVIGVAMVFFDVAYPSFIPTVVPRENITRATGRLYGAQSFAQAAGPGLSGFLVGRLGASWVLIIDALTFVVSTACLVGLQVREAAPKKAVRALWKDMWAGLDSTLRHPILRPTILTAGVYNYWETAATTVFLVYAVDQLGIGIATLGVVLSAGSVGGLVGAAVSGRVVERLGLGRALVWTFVPGALLPMLWFVPRDASAGSIAAFTLTFFAINLCVSIYSVQALSLRVSVTPTGMRGRVSASTWLFVLGSVPLGALTGGALASFIGLRATLAVAVVGIPFSLLILLRSSVPRLRTIPSLDEDYWSRYA
ncbi:MFS transporter [Nocardioides sp. LML1-1-1.1]|uniref:MFS transporter n=1 Tax=Nocardioides sp. LML1-1-1.1 TaxID=3135248 RepID=UPI0034157BC9